MSLAKRSDSRIRATRPARYRWLGVVVFPYRLRHQLLCGADGLGRRLGGWWNWLGVALLVGALPVFLDHFTGFYANRWLTPILVLPILLAAVVRDSSLHAFVVLGGMLWAHCASMIALAMWAPDQWKSIFPPGAEYWEVTRHWVDTGESEEYQLSYWVPGHIQLAVAVVFYTYCSLGLITLWQGFHEVDLMNLYVSQMWLHSDYSLGVLCLAWHPWSVCRGIGFVFLTYELVSWSFQHMTGTQLSCFRSRLARWVLGIGFLLLDMGVKYVMLEPVRQVLERAMV